jgi:hypothetical protein
MRINWGYKIAAAYLLFVAGIMFLVFKAGKQHFDLVTKNYYEEELKYQDVIDKKQNVAALSALPEIKYTKTSIAVFFPKDFENKIITGEAYLYCPSDARKDLRKHFDLKKLDFQWILPDSFRGMYELKLSWISGEKSYYHGKKIFF